MQRICSPPTHIHVFIVATAALFLCSCQRKMPDRRRLLPGTELETLAPWTLSASFYRLEPPAGTLEGDGPSTTTSPFERYMKTRFFFSLSLLLGVQTFSSAPAVAQESSLFQELGLFYTTISSHHPELPSPMGVGAFARWQIAPGWLLRLSYHRTYEHTEKPGIVYS